MPTFPSRLTLDLLELECEMLDYLARHLPQKTSDEIAHGVFSRGLAVVMEEDRRQRGHLETVSSMRPFPKGQYKPPSPVPKEVTIHIDDDLRDRLETLLSERGGDLQSLVERALRDGLKERRKPGSLDPARVFEEEKALNARPAPRLGSRALRRLRLARLLALTPPR